MTVRIFAAQRLASADHELSRIFVGAEGNSLEGMHIKKAINKIKKSGETPTPEAILDILSKSKEPTIQTFVNELKKDKPASWATKRFTHNTKSLGDGGAKKTKKPAGKDAGGDAAAAIDKKIESIKSRRRKFLKKEGYDEDYTGMVRMELQDKFEKFSDDINALKRQKSKLTK